MKKIIFGCAIILLFVFGIGSYMVYSKPIDYISIDINPSVELGINAFNKVVSARAVNKDGKKLLGDAKVVNLDVSDAVATLLKVAADKEYIAEDGSSVVAITAESKNQKKAERLQRICGEAVEDAEKKMNTRIAVYKNACGPSLRQEANELGVTPGKLKLIKTLQVLEPSATVEEYKDAKVADIICRIKELIAENEEVNIDEEILERIEETCPDDKRSDLEELRENTKEELCDIKEQIGEVNREAVEKVNEIRTQITEILASLMDMTEEEKEDTLRMLEELKKQAEAIKKEAKKAIDELKELADSKKGEIDKQLEEIKELIEEHKKDLEGKREDDDKKCEEKQKKAQEKYEEALKRAEEKREKAMKKYLEELKKAQEKLEKARKKQQNNCKGK